MLRTIGQAALKYIGWLALVPLVKWVSAKLYDWQKKKIEGAEVNYDAFHDLVWGPLIRAGLGALFSAIPWLGWGPVGILVCWVVGMFADKLYDAVKTVVVLEAIAFKNEQHRRAFESASIALKSIALHSGVDSQAFKEARDANRKVLAQFIHFDA